MNWFKQSQNSNDIDISGIEFVSEKQDGGGLVRKVLLNGKEVGEVEIRQDDGLEKSSRRLFPNYVKPDDKVFRFYGIYLSEQLRNKGIGKQMFLDAFKAFPDAWLGNSELGYGGTDFAAIYALESLVPQIELHWLSQKGGQWVARLSKNGQENKEPEKYHGSGFYLMSDYLKGGGAGTTAFTTEEAIDRLVDDKKFFPTYLLVNGEAVLDIEPPLLHELHDLGREIMETRDRSKIKNLVQQIKNNIIK